MNIKQAKEQIKKTMQVYFAKDADGHYDLDVNMQRPVFLMGPPGIGKTAIMQQIANELEVGLVTYSMTHHTRQSALGLPFIVEKEFGGQTYHIAEYTMSEIVAAVYKEIEEHGHQEGILFLDEMNCVSETLAPAMLQFLQYKIFGSHQIPKGWLVVTAGNPPEYNKSVREFDLVTWDRLKRMDVEPDIKAWKEYARERQVHPAIMTYLELHPEHFYHIERTMDGQDFVTARGWEDLSVILQKYEKYELEVDETLFGQYLQCKQIAEEFAIYYDLYNKYQSDYQIDQILAGTVSEAILDRAKNAPFDERVTLTGMVCAAIKQKLTQTMESEEQMLALRDWLKVQKEELLSETGDSEKDLIANGVAHAEDLANQYQRKLDTARLTKREQRILRGKVQCFYNVINQLKVLCIHEKQAQFDAVMQMYKSQISAMKERAERDGAELSCVFAFVHQAFGNGTEMLLLLSELTEDAAAARFIARYGCEAYYQFSNDLMVQERQNQILAALLEEDL